MIQVHYSYYYNYISSTSDHQALDPRGWGPLDWTKVPPTYFNCFSQNRILAPTTVNKKRLHVKRASRARWGAVGRGPLSSHHNQKRSHRGKHQSGGRGGGPAPAQPQARFLSLSQQCWCPQGQWPGHLETAGGVVRAGFQTQLPRLQHSPRQLRTPGPKASALDKGGSQLLPVFQTASRKPPSTSPPKGHSAS